MTIRKTVLQEYRFFEDHLPDSLDVRGLRSLAETLKSNWAGGLVVTQGNTIEVLDSQHKIWGIPALRLLS